MVNRITKDDMIFVVRATSSFLLMTFCSLAMLSTATATLFQARRFYSERIATPFAHLVLAVWGIHVELKQTQPFPLTQVVYISNHTSTLDMFVLLSLGLPNARFFLSGYLRKLLPLGLIGYLIGIFWTVDQKFPEKRTRIFKRAAATLKRTGESVYLSPEGKRVLTGEIGHFNKGSFHLATFLKAPIVPLHITIPREMDPGVGLRAKPGVVQVYVKPTIDTQDWHIGEIIQNKERVRNLFVQWHQEHKC